MRSLRQFVVPAAGFALTLLSLQGCTYFERVFGGDESTSDESGVVSRAPLAIPPDYASRPPRPNARRPQEKEPTEQARDTVFRAGQQEATLPPPATERSPGEGDLLRQAGAANAASNIRALVNAEAAQNKPIDEAFVDKLLFWHASDTAEVIDPEKEAERVRARQAADNAQPNPRAPSIELTHTPSLFERLF